MSQTTYENPRTLSFIIFSATKRGDKGLSQSLCEAVCVSVEPGFGFGMTLFKRSPEQERSSSGGETMGCPRFLPCFFAAVAFELENSDSHHS